MFSVDVCVVGGGGRVGLPLSIAFANQGLKVVICDSNKARIDQLSRGTMPFLEAGCEEELKRVIGKNLKTTDNPGSISDSRFVIITVDTPVEYHLNPQYTDMIRLFQGFLPYFVKDQYLILRSTIYPGTAERINDFLKEKGAKVHLAFCPERIAEGKALFELANLPQIVSAFDKEGVEAVSGLFHKLTADIVVLEPMEAELAKLFTNTWRYIQFSIANQLFMLADQKGLDFYRILHAMTYKYPRTQGLPSPGFAAGPCLFKDTMQLAAFSNNSFFLGHAAMLVNEGLPSYIVQQLKQKVDLAHKKVGILGMAFKANCDDERDSLSFKLKRLLEMEAKAVYCSDPYVKRDYFISIEELISVCDIIVIATPHNEYRELNIGGNKMLVDVWNFCEKVREIN
jgi:UDP-N-acetyl-D-mannosaminuronic acid dehydrogenase